MPDALILQAEITPDGHLHVDLPADAPRGPVVVTVERDAARPVSPAPEPQTAPLAGLCTADTDAFRRGFGDLLAGWGIQGEPISHEELRGLSRQSGLDPDELSRDLIAAREESSRR